MIGLEFLSRCTPPNQSVRARASKFEHKGYKRCTNVMTTFYKHLENDYSSN